MQKNALYLILLGLVMAVIMGCENTQSVNRNVFRLEDGPNGVAGGSRYGYLGTDQVDGRPIQTVGNDQSGTRYINPVENGNPEGAATNNTSPQNTPDKSVATNQNNVTNTDPSKKDPDPAEPKKPEGNKPYATPVPGKVGHVYSPFASGREVDVNGFPPGTEVRCPYTKRIFRVP
ncbi:MAG: hypothetical protein HRU47_10930 [Verrucomicrobiales bacterium]|nr:hypothetical protein [Verrucomicrobiales bacterium]